MPGSQTETWLNFRLTSQNVDFTTFAEDVSSKIVLGSKVTANNLTAIKWGPLLFIGGNFRFQGAIGIYEEMFRISGYKALAGWQIGGDYVNYMSLNSAANADFIRCQWIAAAQSNISQYIGVSAVLVVEETGN